MNRKLKLLIVLSVTKVAQKTKMEADEKLGGALECRCQGSLPEVFNNEPKQEGRWSWFSMQLENHTETAMASHSSALAWKIPWMEEAGGLQSMGSRRVGHDWATSLSLFTFMHWRRKWHPTPAFLPRDGGAWWAAVYGVTQSDTTEATQQQQQQQITCKNEEAVVGLPSWLRGQESALQCRRRRFPPWSWKIPHAAEQLSPCTHNCLEPWRQNYWAHVTQELKPPTLESVLHNEKPIHSN